MSHNQPAKVNRSSATSPAIASSSSLFASRSFEPESETIEEDASPTRSVAAPSGSPTLQAQPDRPFQSGFSFLNVPLYASQVPPPATNAVQAKESEETEAEEREETTVQTKLAIGKPGDKYEQEADRMATQVMRMPEPEEEIQQQSEEKSNNQLEKETLQPKTLAAQISPLVQRQETEEGEEPEEEDLQAKQLVQPKSNNKAPESNSDLEQQLAGQKGGGQPLPKSLKSSMEAKFQADFSQVRVHSGSSAVQMNKAIGAQAFTHGNDIYFNAGKYNPGSGGQELLAHELTHTIQQTGGVQQKTAKSFKSNKIQTKLSPTTTSPTIQRREEVSSTSPQPVATVQAPTGTGEAVTARSASSEERSEETNTATPVSAAAQGSTGGETPPAEGGSSSGTSGATGGASAPTSPEADPGFQSVVAKGKGVAQEQQQHEPAESESQEAQESAKSPHNEVESQAQDQQVGEMDQQQPGEFDAEAFKTAIFEKLKEITPETEEEAHEFKENNEVDSVRESVSSQVGGEQEQAAAPIEEKTEEDPDTSNIEPRQETPMSAPEQGAAPGEIGAKQATPKPKDDSEVTAPLEANRQELDQQMAEENITEEQLANSNEPAFEEALDEKQQAQTDAAEAPAEYRQQEEQTLGQAQSEAQATAAVQTEAMHGERQDAMSQVEGLQGQTKGEDEQKRTEIANHINGIYERVKSEVETSLNGLEQDVTSQFDQAADRAKQKFEDYVDRKLWTYRLQRYGTPVIGGFLLVRDVFVGLPDEVNQFFREGRQIYLDEMDTALDEIATTVSDRLTEAKQKITDGRQEIQDYVTSLPEDLRHIGQEAADNIQSKFDDLEQQVHDKYDELVNTLAERYRDRLQEVDDRIEEMKAQNRGLIDRAKDAIGGVINTIREIKALLENVLAGARDVINQIIQDPIGFLGKLIEGLKQGFQNFVGNIAQHLQSGLVGWLTGTLGNLGIQIPEDIFSLEGIFSLTTQVLGLTWDYVRNKAVKMFGEPVVSAMEQSVEMFQVIKNDGVGGLWEHLKDQFGDLKESVMGEIQNMLIVQVIQSGITWILSLLNPASAFVRAAKAIFDIIMFFINRGSQIMALVQTITESMSAIANGAVGAVARAIESTLVTALPVVIGFLASLVGIGGLANKVQKIFEKIRKRIDDAIEWVLEKVRRLFKGKRSRDSGEGEETDPEHDQKVQIGLTQIDREESKYLHDSNRIAHKDAEKVAATVRKDNPIFKSIEVIDGGTTWDYEYVASKGRKKGEKKPLTSNQARREVMRMQGIPTSQQPISQSRNASGFEYSYEIHQHGRSIIKSVQQQTLDRSHPGQPHWEAGTVRTDPLTGEIRMNNYGRPKLTNDKSKENYDE